MLLPLRSLPVLSGSSMLIVPFRGTPYRPPTPGGVFGKLLVEKRLPARIRRKFRLFTNLNPKFGQRQGLDRFLSCCIPSPTADQEGATLYIAGNGTINPGTGDISPQARRPAGERSFYGTVRSG